MVRGPRLLAAVFGLGLAACSSAAPTSASGVEREGIVGGKTDAADRAIFGILIKNQSLCSGTLIAPNLVLTARHCVADLSTGDNPIDCSKTTFGTKFSASSFVLSWAPDLTSNVAQSSVYRTSAVTVPDATAFCGNDIALLTLTADVPSSAVTPIVPRVDQAPMDDETFTAVGYGLTDPTDTQGLTAGVRHSLDGLAVGCVGVFDCLGTRAKDDEWAASASICHGDSGGPALDAQGRVIGVASRADTDCSFGLYSTVSSWKSLIVSTAIDAATAGGYEPADWTLSTGASGGSGGTSATGTGGASGRGGAGGAAAGHAGSGGKSGAGGASGRGGASVGGNAGSVTSPVAGAAAVPPDGDGGLVKPGPELGEPCTDGCFGDLLCYSSNGKPPGVCVRPCDASDPSCPDGSECNLDLKACVPKASSSSGPDSNSNTDSGTNAKVSCGCRVGDAKDGSTWPALGVLALCGGMLRRKRRALS